MRKINRREFIRQVLVVSSAGAALSLAGCGARPAAEIEEATAAPGAASSTSVQPPTGAPPTPAAPTLAATAATPTDAPTRLPATPTQAAPTAPAVPVPGAGLIVARGNDAADITRRAVAALGGMERFVKKGADVIVKPNMCIGYSKPEFAATTNPQVVGALVAMCVAAGAKRVRVLDFTYAGSQQEAHATSGIAEAVQAAGGQMEVMNALGFRELTIPGGKALKKQRFYGDVLDADLLINVPIAKTIGSVRLTLGMKNLMGVVENRGAMHTAGLAQSIADINTIVRPQLTVLDAVRILVGNGPNGGSLDDVRQENAVIASADPVAADSYAATLFGMKGSDIPYVRLGAEMGLGEMDLNKLKIEQL